jgi:hypothetical protein
VFRAQRQIGAWWKTSTKFCQRNGCGQMCEDSAWLFVISAVSAMNTNGARKAMAATMSRLWFATASRKRRLRTAAGGFRLARLVAVVGTVALVTWRPPRSAPSAGSCE